MPAAIQRSARRAFDVLAENPHRHNNIKSLKGEFAGYRRYRVGNYRVIYRVAANDVFVIAIADRKDVYE